MNKTLLAAALAMAFSAAPQASVQLLLENPAAGAAAAEDPVKVLAVLQQKEGSLLLELMLKMEKNIHVYSAESLFFAIKVMENDGLAPPHRELPAPVRIRNFDGTTAAVFVGGQKISLRFQVLSQKWSLSGYVGFQACDESKCFLPVKKDFRFSSDSLPAGPVALADNRADRAPSTGKDEGWQTLLRGFGTEGKTGGYQSADRLLSFLEDPAASSGNGFAGKNILLVALLVILGGLALNLTPCVLPMIPVTLAILGAGAQAGSKRRGFLLGSIYGLAMAFSYGMLGIFVVLTGARFGTINSSPVFNLLIAVMFAVLALAMFDIIHIDFTRFRSGFRYKEKNRGRLAVAFIAGIVAAVLAGACVAPVVISTVLYAAALYSGGSKAGILLPFLLGLGMALPWPLAGAGLSLLPKPGGWMTWVRNSFGAIILAVAVYYGYSGVHMLLEERIPATESAGPQETGLAWSHSLEEGLRRAETENRPVFIDFWATWCKNCLAMDATTFRDPAVRKKLSEFVLVKFQAENPRDPAVREVLDRFGVVGLPTYVVLKKNR